MTTSFLSKIIEAKESQIEKAQKEMPLKELRNIAGQRNARARFTDNLSKSCDAINIIAEIKRASPSKGDICPQLDAGKTAVEYQRGGAAAISVLTEPQFFKGSLDDLKEVKKSAGIPVLRKDFILSEYQIYESAAAGADAILLIVKCLDLQQLKDYIQLADSLSMDCLVEVYTIEDVHNAACAQARLIGINNRNLESFDTDIKHSLTIASELRSFQIPVAASGIETPQDIEMNKTFGIHSFLVGESIVRSGDPENFIKRLRGEIR